VYERAVTPSGTGASLVMIHFRTSSDWSYTSGYGQFRRNL